jgi:hypothetical protein
VKSKPGQRKVLLDNIRLRHQAIVDNDDQAVLTDCATVLQLRTTAPAPVQTHIRT